MPDTSDRDDYTELRLALVFNGGVSLAVWMGGVAKEADRFRTAFHRRDAGSVARYRQLLRALRCEVVTDVIAGTSAGGINGALLGYVVANGKSMEAAGADAIRKVWKELADLDRLLGPDTPESALDDRALFDGCAKALEMLRDAPADVDDELSRRVRLTITATDVYGYETSVPGISASDHRLLMRFHHVDGVATGNVLLSESLLTAIAALPGLTPTPGWPFPEDEKSLRDLAAAEAPALLARAARTTASFPIAFAPSRVELDGATEPQPEDSTGLTATPAMAKVLFTHDGQELPDVPNVRYAEDGGLWNNAPFEAVLRAIDRMPGSRDIDRRIIYVVGTELPVPKRPAGDAPSLIEVLPRALTMPSGVQLANDVERISRDLSEQATRQESADALFAEGPPDTFALARQLFPLYRKRRGATGDEVPPESVSLDPQADLAKWHATVQDWQWGGNPLAFATSELRARLRETLRVLVMRGACPQAVNRTMLARRRLSQWARVLSDLADRKLDAGPELSAVYGQLAHDLADELVDVHATLTRYAAADALRELGPLAAGGPALAIKLMLASDIGLHALATDPRKHRIDYRVGDIRPDTSYPLRGSPGAKRPELAGTKYGHFGGFLRASWRLNDWMWGRLDGVTRIVDLLLDREHIALLIGDGDDAPQRRDDLAARLAAIAIPDDVDHALAGQLAEAALTVRGISGALDPSADNAAQLDTWRSALAKTYVSELTDRDEQLSNLRADIRAPLQHAIVSEEAAALTTAIADDGGDPPDAAALSSSPDAGLGVLTEALVDVPKLELFRDAEQAVANVTTALADPRIADALRELAKVTDGADGVKHAFHAAWTYVFHHRHR